MTIEDLLQTFDDDTKIEVALEIVNPFNNNDILRNVLYIGTIRNVNRESIIPYCNASIPDCKLCLDGRSLPFIFVLLKGGLF